ncbi:hypothetical protein ACFLZN_00880 [Nanoarchaeota archaeon]
MGILSWFRGGKKEESKKIEKVVKKDTAKDDLPLPSPVETRKEIPSDIPPIQPTIDLSKEITILEDDSEDLFSHDLPEPTPTKIFHEDTFKAPEPIHPKERPAVNHIFVASDEYSKIIEKTNVIRSKLMESEESLDKLTKLKTLEEKELKKWQEQLDGVERKLTYMETVLNKSGEV